VNLRNFRNSLDALGIMRPWQPRVWLVPRKVKRSVPDRAVDAAWIAFAACVVAGLLAVVLGVQA
jgi:hypothetical protein